MTRPMEVDWSSLWRKEEWWSVWLGFLVLAIGAAGFLDWLPRVRVWSKSIAEAIPASDVPLIALLFTLLLALTGVSVAFTEGARSLVKYVAGFALVFALAALSLIIAKQAAVKAYGLEYVLWALLLGLAISNTVGVPGWLRHAARTELFIKVGLVLLGAEILFQDVLKAGTRGMMQALAVVFIVWYAAYYVARKFKLDEEFSAVLATGVSICGVSAAIAAGGALKADPKKVSHVIALVLLTAVVMLVAMPPLARLIDLPDAIAGAWIGGTIDTTPAVVAAGALYSDVALTIAAVTKLAQNVLIGVVAFVLALYWTLRAGRGHGEGPSVMEIWYRFPKFVLGFVLASALFSVVLAPALGYDAVKSVLSDTKTVRGWLFSLAFVSVGLESKFKDLVEMGRGRPAAAYVVAQLLNIGWTLLVAYAIWGGGW